MKHIIFASYGNDSIALIQWVSEHSLPDTTVLFSDTGWADSSWSERVKTSETWVRSLGFETSRTSSIGMEELVKARKAWPRNGMQFCTLDLKIRPALEWLTTNDPLKEAICLVGVRREESQSRRAFPEMNESSPNHGDRPLWAPLVDVKTPERDELIARAGYTPLPHRSMECFPCINSNRSDLRLLAQDTKRVDEIERIETELGFTSNGKPRTCFRPYRHMGATGIREVVRWATSERGEYISEEIADCESGYCGI